ncbi:Conserved_hypothetical protein [Hexamita inflata]|uniref:Uncharacterized protein n=1 Tax=Hexamita inflata TaxID=28002 RepID=A0AA86RC40_9EUKA|nr:Conserved hypothetical protein [Hexamita inflata]
MKISLNIEASTGNINLIQVQTGNFYINNYYITGIYESQGCVCLGTTIIKQSNVVIKRLYFSSISYIYGNQSSYIFSDVKQCVIEISKVSITIGNVSNSDSLSIASSTITKFQQFGGVITSMNSSRLLLAELSYISFLSSQTQFMMYSGLLIGNNNASTSQILLQGICVQSYIQASTSFSQFGIIGQNTGNLTIKQASISIDIVTNDVYSFGIVGSITHQCQYSSFYNLLIQLSVNYTSGNNNAALIGCQNSQNALISNVSLTNSIFNGVGNQGGLIAQSICNITILNIMISNISIISTGYSGAVTAQSSINQVIKNIQISGCYIYSISFVGGLVAYSDSDLDISQSIIQSYNINAGLNLGAFIGFISVGHQTSVKFVEANNIILFTSGGNSVGTIIGKSFSNDSINNVKITNANISNTGGYGASGIIGCAITNITVFDSYVFNIRISAGCIGIGGIVGWLNNAIVVGCRVSALNLLSYLQVGGIIGYSSSISFIYDCIVNGSLINSSQQSGGLIGLSLFNITIRNCSTINSNIYSTTSSAGGFLGISSISTVSNSSVNCTSINSFAQSGGILGITLFTGQLTLFSILVENSDVNSIGNCSVGGIIGITYLTTYINNSRVWNLTLTTFVIANGAGGIVGYSILNITLQNCHVLKVSIIADCVGAGGLIGNSNTSILLNCSVSELFVNSTQNVGGFIGFSFTNMSQIDSMSITISNSSIMNSSLSSTRSGGFLGFVNSNQKLFLNDSQINNVKINGSGSVVIGLTYGTVFFSGTGGSGNYLNGDLQTSCYFTKTSGNGC